MDQDSRNQEGGPNGENSNQHHGHDSDDRWENREYCDNVVRLLSDVSTEIQCDLSGIVIAQPAVAAELKKATRLNEQQQAEVIEDFFKRCAAFMPIAAHFRINIILTMLSMFAEHCNKPVLLKAVEEFNADAMHDGE